MVGVIGASDVFVYLKVIGRQRVHLHDLFSATGIKAALKTWIIEPCSYVVGRAGERIMDRPLVAMRIWNRHVHRGKRHRGAEIIRPLERRQMRKFREERPALIG